MYLHKNLFFSDLLLRITKKCLLLTHPKYQLCIFIPETTPIYDNQSILLPQKVIQTPLSQKIKNK